MFRSHRSGSCHTDWRCGDVCLCVCVGSNVNYKAVFDDRSRICSRCCCRDRCVRHLIRRNAPGLLSAPTNSPVLVVWLIYALQIYAAADEVITITTHSQTKCRQQSPPKWSVASCDRRLALYVSQMCLCVCVCAHIVNTKTLKSCSPTAAR